MITKLVSALSVVLAAGYGDYFLAVVALAVYMWYAIEHATQDPK